MSTSSTLFGWSDGSPSNETEFDRLMWALDNHLAEKVGQPQNRLMGFYIEDALRRAGLECGARYVWGSDSVNKPGYEGEVLVAKAYQWYEQVYGEKVFGRNAVADRWSTGFFPAKLGNGAAWKVRIPLIFGCPRFVWDPEDFEKSGQSSHVSHEAEHVNILRLIENLPVKLVGFVSEEEQSGLITLCATALHGTRWLRDAAKKSLVLFQHARQDYVSSTANLLSYNYSQSRWSSSQAIEKIMKGVLGMAGKNYPQKGSKGHDLDILARVMEKELNVVPSEDCLNIGMWPASARYDDTETTLGECLRANHAVLKIAQQLSEDTRVKRLLDGARA